MSTISKHWLILTQYYPPEIGAPQIRLHAMVRELRRKGVAVEVLTAMPNYPAGKLFPGYTGRWYKRDEIDGVPVRRTWIYAATGKSAVVRLANYLSFTLTALVATLFGPRPDILFVESQPLSLGAIAVLMKWLRGVPYIYNVPDLQVEVARQLGFMQNRAFLRLAHWLEDRFLHQSWKVSTVTHHFIEYFLKRGLSREHITFLPNGADTEFLRPLPPSNELLDRWNLHGKKVVVYVGTHAYYHGLDTLIEAARLLRDRNDLVFLMIGNGPERPRLQRLAEEYELTNIIFGQSPYAEMDKLYSIAYASVATLRNMPVAKGMRLSKVFPSLSCGVPVIYAGAGESAELLTATGCGLVVPPESPTELADAIIALVEDPAKRDSLGHTGRELVVREYSWFAITEKWMQELATTHAH